MKERKTKKPLSRVGADRSDGFCRGSSLQEGRARGRPPALKFKLSDKMKERKKKKPLSRVGADRTTIVHYITKLRTTRAGVA
jgi:hypothetical protein